MEPRRWRVAVVGGGLSGLAAAHRLKELCAARQQPLELTLLESSARLGGVIETRRLDGYLVESGADSFVTDKSWAVDLCQRLHLEDALIPTEAGYRRSLVLRRGRPVPVPEGFSLMAPSRLWPVFKSPVLSPSGKLRLALEYLVPARTDDGDESLGHFVRRRLGREAFERLVQPLVAGIYTADPDRLSLKATLPRFIEMERRHGSLIRASRKRQLGSSPARSTSGARYELFMTLADGMSTLIDALVASLSQSATVRIQTAVRGLTREKASGEFRLHLEDGSTHTSDAVVLAIPAYRAANLLADVSPSLSDALCEIPYASSAIVVTGHRLSDVGHPLDAFGLVVPAIERRRILAVSFASRKFPGRAPAGCVQLRTFVGGALQSELLEQSDEELLAIVRQELAEILGVRGEPQCVSISRWQQAMPQYHTGHLDRVDRIEQEVAKQAGLALAGNAYRGVGIPDCIHSGEQAAERLMAGRAGWVEG